MYIPDQFRETRPEVLHEAVRAIGLATLVTQGAGGIEANHLPLLLEDGVLRGHFARAKPVWKSLGPDAQALAIFLGPHGYVSPGWYPSKAETGKAVPTWNYMTVHARGRIRLIEDPAWLRAHAGALSDVHETGRPAPWHLDDAPAGFIDGLLRAIVGFEITVTRLEGKWKLNQNRSGADIEGVRDGLTRDGNAALAGLMGK
jgi:transcriptional regulator